MPFTLTTQTSLPTTGSSVSMAIPMDGNPNVMYLSAGYALATQGSPSHIQQSTEQLNSCYYAYGPAPITVTPMNAALLKPGLTEGIKVPISGNQPVYLSALGAAGSGINILLGVLS